MEFISDIEGLSVEWDGVYGKHWQTFSSEEEMHKALKAAEKNAEYFKTEDSYYAELEVREILEICAEENARIETSNLLKMVSHYGHDAIKHVTGLILAHNKRVIKTQMLPQPAMNSIMDFCNFQQS